MADNRAFAIIQSYQWAQSVIYQGERLFEYFNWQQDAFSKQYEYFDEYIKTGNQRFLDLSNQRQNDFQQNRFVRMMEEHFFVIALGKSLDYLKVFPEYSHLLQEIDNRFSLRKISDLRNMREHDDEYTSGMGRAQSRFEFLDAAKSHGGDMTGTLCSPTEYNLGNVEIRSIVAYYKSKILDIEIICQQIMESLPIE